MAASEPDPASRLAALASATPASRDRYVDFLRAASILVVVLGHWIIGLIYWRRGVIGSTSAIGVTPFMWAGTWVFQVMPIFFFVGGFSNLVTYDSFKKKGKPTSQFLWSRMKRLLRPSLIFAGIWLVIQVVLHLTRTGGATAWGLRGVHPPGATIPFGPLWFLAVYAGVVLLSPIALRAHRRFGVAVPVALIAGTVLVDAAGFVGGHNGVRWINVALVWLLPHQLGFFYADGRLPALGRAKLAVIALSGLATLALITSPIYGRHAQQWFPGVGHYPRSLLGTDVEPITNTNPPTLALTAMALWSIGIAMLLRDRITAWLAGETPWRRVIAVNSAIMTIYLWHMTAFLIAVVLLWPLGLGSQPTTTARWWLERPVWVLVPAVFLLGLVAVFSRFERPPAAPAPAG